MAIKFVDIEPEGGKPKKAPAKAEPQVPAEAAGEASLPHAKSEPKARGRKKPLR